MKHPISKVVTLATLAFIGIGFAGTQQAEAQRCTPDDCSGYYGAAKCGKNAQGQVIYTATGGYSAPNYYATALESVMKDCAGTCTKVPTNFRVNYANCTKYNANGTPVVPKSSDPTYDKYLE